MYSAYACHKSEYTTMAFLPMKMWLQQQAIKRKKLLQPGSNELKLYPFKSIAEIRINKGSIINVGATHIRVVANIFCCNKIDIYKLIPYH